MTFNQWLNTPAPRTQRLGQHLFNTAPGHVCKFAAGVMDLDPFYVEGNAQMYILNNFIQFAELVWDVTDENEIKLARQMVMSQLNARRAS